MPMIQQPASVDEVLDCPVSLTQNIIAGGQLAYLEELANYAIYLCN